METRSYNQRNQYEKQMTEQEFISYDCFMKDICKEEAEQANQAAYYYEVSSRTYCSSLESIKKAIDLFSDRILFGNNGQNVEIGGGL